MLQSIQPIAADEVAKDAVRGQYGAGQIAGAAVLAYRAEPGVNPDSMTETYVAMRVMIDNWRWAGVPFLLRTGKRTEQRMHGDRGDVSAAAGEPVSEWQTESDADAEARDLPDAAGHRGTVGLREPRRRG